jgi:HEAT repeat protein
MRRQSVFIAAGVLLLLIVTVAGIWFFTGSRELTADEWLEKALTGQSLEEREAAAVALSDLNPPALPQLRQLLKETKDPTVKSATIAALGRHYDFDSMEAIIAAMEDESSVVRGRAAAVVARFLGRDRRFRADGPEADRARIIKYSREDWEMVKTSPHFEGFKRKIRGDE